MDFILNGKKRGDARPERNVLPRLRDVEGIAFDGVRRTSPPMREMKALGLEPKSKSKSK